MSESRTRKMFSRRILLAGLAVVVGCGRSPSVVPFSAPKRADASIDAPANDLSQVEAARDQKPSCCENAAVASAPTVATSPPIKAEPLSRGIAIPDVNLLNHEGQPVRFRSDLVKGKIVAVNFIFTSCQGICPPMSANFAKLQARLGDWAGN